MSGTRRPSAEIDAAILDAARTGFAERGYSATTLREIAERAGVYEPMIYRRFESKAELFEQAVFEPLNAVIAEYLATFDAPASASAAPASTEELVRNFVPPLYALMREQRESILAVLSATEFHEAELRGLEGTWSAGVRSLIARLEPHVADEASRRPLPDLDAARALLISFGMVLGLALLDGAIHAEGHADLGGTGLVEELVKFTLFGVSARPPADADGAAAGGADGASDARRSVSGGVDVTELFERIADAERRAVRAEVELEHLRRQLG